MDRMSSHTTSEPGSRKAFCRSSMRACALGVPKGAPSMAPVDALLARLSEAHARCGVLNAHEPGSPWEEGVTNSGAPGVKRLAVSPGELGEPLDTRGRRATRSFLGWNILKPVGHRSRPA